MFDLISLAKCLRRTERSFSLLTTTDEIGVGVRLGESYCTLLRTLMQSIDLSHAFADRVFLFFCSSLTENTSELDWSEGKWKPYGKDLKTVLQSEEAHACTE